MQFPNIFSATECLDIIKIRNMYSENYSDLVFWRDKVGQCELEKLCVDLELKLKPLVEEYFNNFGSLLTISDVSLLGIGIIKQPTGAYDDLHFDTQVIVGEEAIKQRPFVCLLYLNDKEFEGGQLCFPIQKVVIAPEIGKVVIFPASYHFPHQVVGISGGDRYFLRMNFMFKESLLDKDVDEWDIETDGVMKF